MSQQMVWFTIEVEFDETAETQEQLEKLWIHLKQKNNSITITDFRSKFFQNFRVTFWGVFFLNVRLRKYCVFALVQLLSFNSLQKLLRKWWKFDWHLKDQQYLSDSNNSNQNSSCRFLLPCTYRGLCRLMRQNPGTPCCENRNGTHRTL